MNWLYSLYTKGIILLYTLESYIKIPTPLQASAYGAIGIIGGFISQAFGGWSPLLTLLTILFIADYASGILASIKEGKGIKSSISFWGLINKSLMLLSILIGHHIDIVMGTSYVMVGAIWFWIANELTSLTENYARLGLPMADVIKDKIAIFKGKSKGKEDKQE